MNSYDWINNQELKKAKNIAYKIYDNFCKDFGQEEQTWTEIEINGKFFDVECFDEDIDKPRRKTYCSIYPTYPTKCGTWRETDGNNYIRLFTKKEETNGN